MTSQTVRHLNGLFEYAGLKILVVIKRLYINKARCIIISVFVKQIAKTMSTVVLLLTYSSKDVHVVLRDKKKRSCADVSRPYSLLDHW